MAGNKSRPGKAGVGRTIAKIKDPERRQDCDTLVRMMWKATGEKPVMWGSIAGFGRFHDLYQSGREGDWPSMGFAKPGRHRTGKSCLYPRRLADMDRKVLERILVTSARRISGRRNKMCS